MPIPTGRVLEKLDSYLQRNDYEAARRHLLYWLSESELAGDGNGKLLLLNELMGLTRKLAEEAHALSYAQAALEQVRDLGIEDNIGAATTYLNAATVYKAFKKADAALPLFQKATAIYEAELAPTDDRLGGLYNNMALALVDLGRFEEAELSYGKAIAIMETISGKEPEAAITWLNLASCAEARYDRDTADIYIEEYAAAAIALLDLGKDRQDGNYAFVCEKCAPVLKHFGYTDYAAILQERCRRIYEGT